MDNDIFHKFTHKFIPINTIYDQLPNGPLRVVNPLIIEFSLVKNTLKHYFYITFPLEFFARDACLNFFQNRNSIFFGIRVKIWTLDIRTLDKSNIPFHLLIVNQITNYLQLLNFITLNKSPPLISIPHITPYVNMFPISHPIHNSFLHQTLNTPNTPPWEAIRVSPNLHGDITIRVIFCFHNTAKKCPCLTHLAGIIIEPHTMPLMMKEYDTLKTHFITKFTHLPSKPIMRISLCRNPHSTQS